MLLRRESEKETGREFLLFFPPPRFASLFLFCFLKKEFGTANSFFRFFTHTSGTQEEKKRIERK